MAGKTKAELEREVEEPVGVIEAKLLREGRQDALNECARLTVLIEERDDQIKGLTEATRIFREVLAPARDAMIWAEGRGLLATVHEPDNRLDRLRAALIEAGVKL